MKALIFGILAVLLALAVPVSAQTPCSVNCVLTAGQSYTAVYDHDGLNTTGYRFYIDGTKVGTDIPMSALQSGSVTVPALVAPTRGTHTVQMGAFNQDFETKSDPTTFTTVLSAPKKPGNLRLLFTVTLAEDGSIQWKFLGIDTADPVPVPPGGGV